MMESTIAISAKANIYAKLFEPDNLETNTSVVIAGSIFSENKFSRSFIMNNARYLCNLGYRVIFFDYRGVGESEGDSMAMSIKSMFEDIDTVISYIKTKFPQQNIVLIGFRGGAIPALCFVRDSSISLIMLWEPVRRGAELIRYRNLITTQKRYIRQEQEKNATAINVGGWYINTDFCEAIKKWQMDKLLYAADSRKLYQIHFKPTAKALPQNSAEYNSIDYVVSDKFWHFGSNRLFIDPAKLTHNRIKVMLTNRRFYGKHN